MARLTGATTFDFTFFMELPSSEMPERDPATPPTTAPMAAPTGPNSAPAAAPAAAPPAMPTREIAFLDWAFFAMNLSQENCQRTTTQTSGDLLHAQIVPCEMKREIILNQTTI